LKLEEKLQNALRAGTIARVGDLSGGVSKERIRAVLGRISRENADTVDAVFALLDGQTTSFFTGASNLRFCEGATTAHIACHIGILQRESGKLDREGRDYWLKPLWEIGAMEKVFYTAGVGFDYGHPVAKSPFSAYRLAASFVEILRAPEERWGQLLSEWSAAEPTRVRLERQASMAAVARARVDTKHADLIQAIITHYVPTFLSGFEVVYVDDSDGDRVSAEQRRRLESAGLDLLISDSMPDVLLWNRSTDSLWVVEAVCSDGEVDNHKLRALTEFSRRCGKSGIEFTTAYRTWKEAGARQGTHRNLAVGSYLWVLEDGSRQFFVQGGDV